MGRSRTGRAQWQAVTAGLAEHLRHVSCADFDVEDLAAPRRNILVLHGVGGIGKSTLSRKIEASLARSEHRPVQWESPSHPEERTAGPYRPRAPRALLGAQPPGRTHRGLPAPGRTAGPLQRRCRPAPADAVRPQRHRPGSAAAPGTVGRALGHGTGALIKALRERHQSVRALAGCSRLADLLEAEPGLEALSFYPHLLAWDLAQLTADESALPAILLDTFEDTGDRTHRDFEHLLQRVVWLMPNAFFVITGRTASSGRRGSIMI